MNPSNANIIPAPIFFSNNMQAAVPMTEPVPAPVAAPVPVVSMEAAANRRYGAKIKAAALVVIAFWILSSQPSYNLMNTIICSFSLSAAPCISEQGPTLKGLIIAGCILFVFTMYLLGGM